MRRALGAAPRRAHRTAACRGLAVDKLEVDLTLGKIDPIQSNLDLVPELPAPAGALPDQAHAALFQFPIVSRNG
jgi:hypothetical protein